MRSAFFSFLHNSSSLDHEKHVQGDTRLHGYDLMMRIQERLSVLAAPRMVRSTFLFARLRSAGGVYLSGGLKHATETSKILIYPPLIEAGVFPTEIKASCRLKAFSGSCGMHKSDKFYIR